MKYWCRKIIWLMGLALLIILTSALTYAGNTGLAAANEDCSRNCCYPGLGVETTTQYGKIKGIVSQLIPLNRQSTPTG